MPLTSIHPSAIQLHAFLVGKVTAGEAAEMESHLESCPECQRLLSPEADDDLLRRIREAMSATPTPLADTLDVLPKSPAEVNPYQETLPYPGEQAVSQPSTSAGQGEIPPELEQHPRYQVLRMLGQGGMGAVYLARHRHLERLVAIKVIRPDLLSTMALPRFQREAKVAAGLAHPNIVQVYDADQAGDLHFLVMEYIEGIDMARMLQEQKSLTVPLACDLTRQAALGLQHAYEHGMIHRDIKPHNLMVTARKEVKITDQGEPDQEPLNFACGTSQLGREDCWRRFPRLHYGPR